MSRPAVPLDGDGDAAVDCRALARTGRASTPRSRSTRARLREVRLAYAPVTRRRARPGRDRVDLGALRGARRARQGPPGRHRRGVGRRRLPRGAAHEQGARRRSRLRRPRRRCVGLRGPAELGAHRPGVPRAGRRHATRGGIARRAPVRAASPVRSASVTAGADAANVQPATGSRRLSGCGGRCSPKGDPWSSRHRRNSPNVATVASSRAPGIDVDGAAESLDGGDGGVKVVDPEEDVRRGALIAAVHARGHPGAVDRVAVAARTRLERPAEELAVEARAVMASAAPNSMNETSPDMESLLASKRGWRHG